jgi:hypothetical protein
MAKKDKKKKDSPQDRGREIVDEVTKAVGRIREELSQRNVSDDLKGLRNEVEKLARRVAALEVPGRGSPSPARTTAARKPAASRSTAAKKPAASRSTAAKKPAASRSTAAKKPAASRSTAAKKPAASRSRSTAAKKPSASRSRSTSTRSRTSGSSS